MRTRTKGAAKATESPELQKQTTPGVQLGPESSNPPRLFILPKHITPEARVVSLTNPRYSTEDRYIICPKRGVYEFTKIAAPKVIPRSWLLTPGFTQEGDILPENGPEKNMPDGFVSRDADLFISTPIDPLFFLLPALNPPSKSTEPAKRLFLTSDDYFEEVTQTSCQFSKFLRMGEMRESLERRLKAVCETVVAGDESMYRLSEEMLIRELLYKARRMVARGLPPSIEEKLVKKALEAPMLSITREGNDSFSSEFMKEEATTPSDSAETTNTQTTISTVVSSATSFSESSVTTPIIDKSESSLVDPASPPADITELLRLRTALYFICSNYLPPYLSNALKRTLSSTTSPVDFTKLDEHLTHLAKLRKDAVAARSLSDYSRKRGLDDDDEAIEIRAEKKRKIDEEEKRKKAGMSMGVKKLQKVNVSGMKKMSDFFKKK